MNYVTLLRLGPAVSHKTSQSVHCSALRSISLQTLAQPANTPIDKHIRSDGFPAQGKSWNILLISGIRIKSTSQLRVFVSYVLCPDGASINNMY